MADPEGRRGGASADAAVRIEGLHKSYGGVRAVDGVDLSLREGEFVTLLGPSGCGKSTTLRLVAGLERTTKGRIELFGQVVADSERGLSLPPNQRAIGMVFQSYALWPHMTALDNVAFPLRNGKAPDRSRGSRVKDGRKDGRKDGKDATVALAMAALERVKCDHLRDRYPGEMSGGQQQRVALARAIVHAPPLVLLDEPLSNLDAGLRRDLRLELRRLQESVGFTALYVTHDQTEALAMSDRVVLMRDGRVEQVATPQRLFEWPATPYAARFIGDHNVLDGEIVDVDPAGIASVRTAAGLVRARAPREEVEAAVGADCVVAIRTDRVEIQELKTDDATDADGTADGVVVGSAYNGAYVDMVVATGETQQVMVRDYSGAPASPRGARVRLRVLGETVLTEVGSAGAGGS